MTPIAQMDCCTMLGIGPKTLRNWLRHANMPFSIHPTDARLKCLMLEQVQQLATLHARPLQKSPPASPALPTEVPPLDSSQGQTAAAQANVASPVSPTSSLSEEAEVRQVVCGLEAKVLTLHEQLTQLTFELLRERTQRYEQRLSTLEALLSPHAARSSSAQELVSVVDQRPHSPSVPQRPLQQAELRARSRILPRIEYGAQGLYVLICPQEGVLSFPIDSPQWFDWLASLVSFRFLGSQGRFSAYREGQTRSWKAYRTFHGRSHKRSLGITDLLTIARLEEVAASLQSEMTSL
ncbi:MAG: hypothetical protein NVS4B9_37030 [Ktedonobacteraceae bacterium]